MRSWRLATSKKNKSASSHRWLQEHESDQYVIASRKDGYRSRAAYKLLEIQEKIKLIKLGMKVVDLGAAPGGWTQIAAKLVGEKGHVYALDILEMEAVFNATIIQGDFLEQSVLDQLLCSLDKSVVDLVISDMAPNMSGMSAVDQPKGMALVELALDCAGQILKPGGDFLTKAFQGEGFDEFVKDVRSQFKTVVIKKPKSSRDRSRELYVLGRSFNM